MKTRMTKCNFKGELSFCQKYLLFPRAISDHDTRQMEICDPDEVQTFTIVRKFMI